MNKSNINLKHLILLYLLQSNDIQPNPGPNTIELCTMCKKPAFQDDSLKCQTCNGLCHLSCSGVENALTSKRNDAYQWICPIEHCTPNYTHCKLQKSEVMSPNKYKILVKLSTNSCEKKTRKCKPSLKNKQPT